MWYGEFEGYLAELEVSETELLHKLLSVKSVDEIPNVEGVTIDNRMMLKCDIIKNGEVRELEGKKNFIADENLMNKALQLMATELSVVLLIEKDAALEMIREKLFG